MNPPERKAESLVPPHILTAQDLPATSYYPAHTFSLETDVMLLEETQRNKIHRQSLPSQINAFQELRDNLISAKKLHLVEFSALHGRFLNHQQYPSSIQLQNRYANLMLTYTGAQTWAPRSYNLAMLFLTRQRYMGIIKSQIINSNAPLAAYIPPSHHEPEQPLSIPSSAAITPITPVTPATPSNIDSITQIRRRRKRLKDRAYRVKTPSKYISTAPKKVLPTRIAKKELCYAEEHSTDDTKLDIQSPHQTPLTITPRSSARIDLDSDDTSPTPYSRIASQPRRTSLAIRIPDQEQCNPLPTTSFEEPTQLFQTPARSTQAPPNRSNTTPSNPDEATSKSRLDAYEKQLGDVQTMVLSINSVLHGTSQKVQNMETNFDSLKDSICKIQTLLQGALERKEKARSNSRKRKLILEESSNSDVVEEQQGQTNKKHKSQHIGKETDNGIPEIDRNLAAASASKDQQPNNPTAQGKCPSDQRRDGGSMISRLTGLLGGYFVRRKANV